MPLFGAWLAHLAPSLSSGTLAVATGDWQSAAFLRRSLVEEGQRRSQCVMQQPVG